MRLHSLSDEILTVGYRAALCAGGRAGSRLSSPASWSILSGQGEPRAVKTTAAGGE